MQHGFELLRTLTYAEHPEEDGYEVSYLLKRTGPVSASKDKHKPAIPAKSPSIAPNRQGPVVLVSRAIAFTFPLAYAYLAGQLRSQGEEVKLLFKEMPFELLVKQIMALNPMLVGFGNCIPNWKKPAD